MIKIENLKKIYDKGRRHATEVIHSASLELPDVGFVAILGESGSGKTSLLNAVGGLDSFQGGKITVGDTEITSHSGKMENVRNESFGYVFQNYYLLDEHSAAYNVYIGMHALTISEEEKLSRVKDALIRVDMLRYAKRPVGELSGGQQQRVAIARAIARRPKVIFADEPTGNLDEDNTLNICKILKELSRDSLIVMVTHERRIASFFADRIITIEDGNIVSDTTDLSENEMDMGEKDTIYTADYDNTELDGDGISISLYREKDAAPVKLTVVAEAGRIVIKTSDPRTVLSTDTAAAPYLKSGKRPTVSRTEFNESVRLEDKEKSNANDGSEKKKPRSWLPLGVILNEARHLVGGRKRTKLGTGIFVVLLSLVIAISAADISTLMHANPETFISTSSHELTLALKRGALDKDKYGVTRAAVKNYMSYLDGSGIDFDYIPSFNNAIKFTDTTIPQLGSQSMKLSRFSITLISRLDESTLLYGRMPERSDEVVVDRWVLDKSLDTEGILQNTIPDAEYLLGREIYAEGKTTKLKIVGISDSGEPAIYMSREAILAYGTCGSEVITKSEYERITGEEITRSMLPSSCIVLTDNALGYSNSIPISSYVGSDYPLYKVGVLADTDDSIGAKLIIADEALEPLYRTMIEATTNLNIWFADKAEFYEFTKQPLPEEIDGLITVEIHDAYKTAYEKYTEASEMKLDARSTITASIILVSIVMLYLMQRSKILENMDTVAVYRMLGIKKRNIITIFSIENLILTVKFALPSVAAVWLVTNALSLFEEIKFEIMYFPWYLALITLVFISVIRIILAALPLVRLLSAPPAKLAAKHDF